MKMKKIIYDFGANNGDNIKYYIQKSDMVIAIEADPKQCNIIKDQYQKEIVEQKLFIENCIVTSGASSNSELFYLHKERSLLNQYPRPNDKDLHNFKQTTLPSKNIIEIIKKYGAPYYIKIDLENYDHIVLEELFINNIKPPYISAESMTLNTFAILVSLGNYKSFKLVNGDDVHLVYKNKIIETLNDKVDFSFPIHSAGPFGNDINGSWFTIENFLYLLSKETLGWKDIHCSSLDNPNRNENYLNYNINNKQYLKDSNSIKSDKKINLLKKLNKKIINFLKKFFFKNAE
jgi:FkbM family methyltransferase